MNEEHIIQLMDLGQITHIAYPPKLPNPTTIAITTPRFTSPPALPPT